jgi:hypothetical protein
MGTGQQTPKRRADRLPSAAGPVGGGAQVGKERIRWERGRIRRGPERLARIRVRTPAARAILFAPPLVGGGGVHQARTFRPLIAAGYDLFSFCYTGHGRSTGRFSLGASLADTEAALGDAAETAARERLPLLGVAACYGAIPMLHAAARLGEPLGRIAVVNAILDLAPGAVARSFFRYYDEVRRADDRLPRLSEALHRYVDFLFPGVVKSRHGFGALRRSRTRLLTTLRDAFAPSPLAGVRLDRTPALCLYSREDRVLRLYGDGAGPVYEGAVREVLPRARFQRLPGDHFLSGTEARSAARSLLLDFLAAPAAPAGSARVSPPNPHAASPGPSPGR